MSKSAKSKRRVGKAGRLLERIGETAELPQGLLTGGVHIELNSNREVLIDGRSSVIEYTENEIRLNIQTGSLRLIGSSLGIVSMSPQGTQITGKIHSLEFSDQ
ncbi:MAG: YabP/YqfC family sporulation protein [Acutalibacteraceae bacterium]